MSIACKNEIRQFVTDLRSCLAVFLHSRALQFNRTTANIAHIKSDNTMLELNLYFAQIDTMRERVTALRGYL